MVGGRRVRKGRGYGLSNGRCLLCGEPDSCGHLAGGCKHRIMRTLYIWRHDKAVRMIHKWIRRHARHGGAYAIMDACKAANLEALAADGKRVPEWTLPAVPAEDRCRLRPDMLRILELPTHPTGAQMQHAAEDKGSYTVQVMEVVCCPDTRWEGKATAKRAQHAELKELLRRAGWRVDEKEYVILLGTAGTVYRQSLEALQNAGLPAGKARELLQQLHVGVVLALQEIVATRRRLE